MILLLAIKIRLHGHKFVAFSSAKTQAKVAKNFTYFEKDPINQVYSLFVSYTISEHSIKGFVGRV